MTSICIYCLTHSNKGKINGRSKEGISTGKHIPTPTQKPREYTSHKKIFGNQTLKQIVSKLKNAKLSPGQKFLNSVVISWICS